MNNVARGFTVLALTATVGCGLTAATAVGDAASAVGKSTLGCSQPYQLDSIQDIYNFSLPLIEEGYFTPDSAMAFLNSLDHNGDGYLCYKLPSGWNGPPATNGANKEYFVNLVDDKIISD